MKIRLKSNIFGAWKAKRGEVVDRPESEARKLIASGFAVADADPAKPEQKEAK